MHRERESNNMNPCYDTVTLFLMWWSSVRSDLKCSFVLETWHMNSFFRYNNTKCSRFLEVKPLETFQQCPGFSWHLITRLREENMFLQSQKTSMQSLSFNPSRYTQVFWIHIILLHLCPSQQNRKLEAYQMVQGLCRLCFAGWVHVFRWSCEAGIRVPLTVRADNQNKLKG